MSSCVIMLLIEGRLLESLNLRKLLSFNKDIFLLFIKSRVIAWCYDCYMFLFCGSQPPCLPFFLWIRLSLCRSRWPIHWLLLSVGIIHFASMPGCCAIIFSLTFWVALYPSEWFNNQKCKSIIWLERWLRG